MKYLPALDALQCNARRHQRPAQDGDPERDMRHDGKAASDDAEYAEQVEHERDDRAERREIENVLGRWCEPQCHNEIPPSVMTVNDIMTTTAVPPAGTL